jgi:hypothetical protein
LNLFLRGKEEAVGTAYLVLEEVEGNEAVGAQHFLAVQKKDEAGDVQHAELTGEFAMGWGVHPNESDAGKLGF